MNKNKIITNKKLAFFAIGSTFCLLSISAQAQQPNINATKVSNEKCNAQTYMTTPAGISHQGKIIDTERDWYQENKRYLGKDFIGAKSNTIIFDFELPINDYSVYMNDAKYNVCYNITKNFNKSYKKYLVYREAEKEQIINKMKGRNLNLIFDVTYQNNNLDKLSQQYEADLFVEEPEAYAIWNSAKSKNGYVGRLYRSKSSGSSGSSSYSNSTSSGSGSSDFQETDNNQSFGTNSDIASIQEQRGTQRQTSTGSSQSNSGNQQQPTNNNNNQRRNSNNNQRNSNDISQFYLSNPN